MKRLLICAAATVALSASAALADDLTQAPRYGDWGFDTSARDTTVSPGDDFYRYAEGKAVDAMQIPSDRSRYGAFDKLRELSESRSRAVIEKAAADPHATGVEAKIGEMYSAFMDQPRVDRLGATPLRRELAAIRKAKTRAAIAALMGGSNRNFGATIFAPYIATDAKASTRYVAHLTQAGLGLPDRDYYLKDSFAPQKAKYQTYVAATLRRIGWANPGAKAKAILAMENEIAQVSWSKADQRDDTKTYNPMSPSDLRKAAPGFPWRAFLKAASFGGANRLIVDENTAFPKIAAVFAKTPTSTLRAWLAFNLADNASPYLSEPFDDAHFDFHSKTLSGTPEQRPRWKRGVELVGNQLGEAVGKLYIEAYFTPEAKAKMDSLVGQLRGQMQLRIQKLDWMSPQTKEQALAKLAKFRVKIGYPVKWRDYSALSLSRTDLYGDVERAAAFDWNRRLKRINDPVDKDEWDMTPQTVNAYYSQTGNEIVFPAAILQPPFFDPAGDMAVNYGGIGGVIGHEMTHGFDDEGRQSDGDGQLRDWWTAEDSAKFDAQAKNYGAQYSAFEALPGAHVNGDLTMGENIADLGGLLLGLDAYHASLNGQPAPVIDGLTGGERGSDTSWRFRASSRYLARHTCAQPRNTRWSPVSPSITGAGWPFSEAW